MTPGPQGRAPDPAFWSGKRVLLTGHTGFKGSWAALWLTQMGAQVTGFALAPDTTPALFDLARVGERVVSIIGDLRERNAVRAAVERADPQIVLHMAAQPIVRRAIKDPVETMGANVMGTTHLLDALRARQHLEAILVVTSDKVYANNDAGHAFVEADRLGGKDPYSASKAATELVAQAFAATYFTPMGVPLASARGGNVLGGGDYADDRIVPDIIRAAQRGEKLTLRMPAATRPWQHVLDCVAGYLLYAQALVQKRGASAPPRALNFGPQPGHDVTVGALTDAMQAALGVSGGWDHRSVPGSVEMKALAVDATLARTTLDWRDRLAGESLVAWTADWYRRVGAGNEDARAVTLEQIARWRDDPSLQSAS